MNDQQKRLAMRRWWQRPFGQHLFMAEKRLITDIVPKFFGYYLLLLAEPEFIESAKLININQRILVHQDEKMLVNATIIDASGLCTREDKLPIAAESIDVVYLAHALEVTNNPHEVLREAYRVLRPEGHLLISSLNPWSWLGLWRIIMRISGRMPWAARFISNLKLLDWLYLLGFDIIQSRTFGHTLPINQQKFLAKTRWLEKLGNRLKSPLGAATLVIACKRVIPLTPIRPRWNEKIALADGLAENNLAEPTS